MITKAQIMRAKKSAKSRQLGFKLMFPIPEHWKKDNEKYVFHHVDDEHVVVLPEYQHKGGMGHRFRMIQVVQEYYRIATDKQIKILQNGIMQERAKINGCE